LLALLTAGCAGDAEPAAPDPAVVEVLADVLVAESAATVAGADADSARTAALAAHGADARDLARWLESAARQPDDGSALWSAVARQIESERLAPDR
jgi:hypothetical protein